MLKRRVCVSATIVVMVLVFSVFVRFSIRDRAVYGASNMSDLKNIDFMFPGVYVENRLPSEDVLLLELKECDYILEVTPTGNIKVVGYGIMQEVKVNKCIKGGIVLAEIVWIYSYNGFWYDELTDTTYNWGMDNLMAEKSSYIVVLDTMSYKDNIYYYNEFKLGALRCSEEETRSCIDVYKKYNYAELTQYEFFAENEATISKMYELKKYVFDYLNEEYNYI